MRITNNTITYNFLNSLNKSLGRQNEIQEQLSDGKAIHRPSDNPVKVIRSLRFNTNLAQNEQFTQNAKDALSWMETTDGAISDLSSIVIQAKELTIKAVSANPDDAYDAIASELDGLINHLVSVGNTKIGDRYIFSGQQDKIMPFERVTDASGDHVIYHGDASPISMRIQPGDVNPEQDSVSIPGNELFGDASGVTSLIDNLIKIKEELQKNPPDQSWLSNTGLKLIDDAHTQVLKAQTKVGTRMSMYEMAKNMLEDDNVTITGDVSANEDLNIAKAIIDFETSQNVYRTALSVGARIMPTSLVDFLK